MFDNLHLTNMLRSEVESIPETGLPLDAFPDKIQEIILNLAKYENFNVEYTVSIILSAVATAIGNSCHIRIKGEWKTCPSLYMMLVGRPGLGKTPPLGFIYKPINEYDDRLHEKYNEELKENIEKYWGKYSFLTLLLFEQKEKNNTNDFYITISSNFRCRRISR